MSKENKKAREELIKIYGEECFIEKLKLRHDKHKKYKGKAQYKRMKQLTYHHILERSKGGKATVENGAILSFENHMWFHQQSDKDREEMNNKFQEYKANFLIGIAEITTEGVQQAEVYEPEPIEEVITIPAYDFTEEEYQEFLQKKRKAELEKPRWKGEER